MPYSRISNVANIFFSALRENKILAKVYEFTVSYPEAETDNSYVPSPNIPGSRKFCQWGPNLTTFFFFFFFFWLMRAERIQAQGSVVKCFTRDRGAAGSCLTGVTALCP